jgi:hypothetical protein
MQNNNAERVGIFEIDSRLDNQDIQLQFLAGQEVSLLQSMQAASKFHPSWRSNYGGKLTNHIHLVQRL